VLIELSANDLDHRRLLLGGSTGLRGVLPEQLAGRNLILANVEYRARPFEILSSWLGLVLFYDVGSAFDETPAFIHTTGIGLRLLLPQLNRDVIRIDLGFIIGGPPPGAGTVNASWGPVTALRTDFLTSQFDDSP
jgi:outer membrane protein assembly factor BamA